MGISIFKANLTQNIVNESKDLEQSLVSTRWLDFMSLFLLLLLILLYLLSS